LTEAVRDPADAPHVHQTAQSCAHRIAVRDDKIIVQDDELV
jgi:hypothetical protein